MTHDELRDFLIQVQTETIQWDGTLTYSHCIEAASLGFIDILSENNPILTELGKDFIGMERK
jgi:hypothetical protein